MKPVCIVVTGAPVPEARARAGSFADMIRRHAASDAPWLEVDAAAGDALPAARDLSGVVITGSAASVTERAPWMLRTEAWLRDITRAPLPVLGICFGHQLLGQALGGRVAKNPRGREIGTVAIDLVADDPLLDRSERPHAANASHVDTVVELPPGAQVIAQSALDPHAGLRFGQQVWGVQFHPEFDAEVMRAYIAARRDAILDEGLDADALEVDADDANFGRAVLKRFVAEVRRAAG